MSSNLEIYEEYTTNLLDEGDVDHKVCQPCGLLQETEEEYIDRLLKEVEIV